MSAKKTNIWHLRKYLNGELNAAAMHRLEREAQDHPFLMEALEGYEANPTRQYPDDELDKLLQQRVDQSKKRHVPWLYITAAASVFLIMTIGYLLWPAARQQPAKREIAAVITPPPADHTAAQPDTLQKNIAVQKKAELLTAANSTPQAVISPARATPAPAAAEIRIDEPAGNSDTRAAPKKVEDMLKNKSGVITDKDGNLIYTSNQVARVRLNEKDYAGGDLKQAVKNLPADVKEKAQVIDDYADQAARTGAKIKNDSLALKEVTVTGYGALTKKDVVAGNLAAQTLQGGVNGVNVTTPPMISGTVYNELGLALPGVHVLVNGTRNSTVTDNKGRFALPASRQATLSLSYIGFENAQVKAGVNDSLQIKLKPVNALLSEVVITGQYGKIKQVVTAVQPRIGWEEYNKYLKTTAVNDEGGTVNLSFTVDPKGYLSNFKVSKGPGDAVNRQAIGIVKNGPAWYGDSDGEVKTIKLKIRFSKR